MQPDTPSERATTTKLVNIGVGVKLSEGVISSTTPMPVELHDFHPSQTPVAPDGQGMVRWVLIHAWRGRDFLLVFNLRRSPAAWETVSGGIEPGESPADCARRELMEEASVVAGSMKCLGTFRIRLMPDGRLSDTAAFFTTHIGSELPFTPTDEIGQICWLTDPRLHPHRLTPLGWALLDIELRQ